MLPNPPARRTTTRPPATIHGEAHWWDRWRAIWYRSSWALRPLGILIALLSMFAITFILYTFVTLDGTYWREITVAMIGTLLTISASLGIALLAFRDQLRAHREHERLRRFDDDTWPRESLTVGAMTIPDIVVIASASHGRAWTDSARMRWASSLDAPRPADELLMAAREVRIPEAQARARRDSIALTDDPCVDLRRVRITLEREGDRRLPVYNLTAAPSTYFDFLSTAAELDAPLPLDDGSDASLRERWAPRVRSIEDLDRLPMPAKIGCGTAVVTRDGRLVLGVRGRTMIAGAEPDRGRSRPYVHIVAEGMTPDDVDADGRISPAMTSIRGLHEELSIGSSSKDLGSVVDHVATGFFFDHLRMQPCFAYLARISLTWDELRSAAPASQDFWEVSELRDLPFDISHVGLRRLLLARHPDMELASNHAAAVVWFACLHEFGFHRMRDALSIPLPPINVERTDID